MNTLMAAALAAILLSGSSAAVPALPLDSLAAQQSANPQACIDAWIQLGNQLVQAGYARHSGTEWQNGVPVMIEAAFDPAACPAVIGAARQLYGAGCDIARESEITRIQSEQSDAQYRACQDRFPDTFDRACASYFAFDQQVSGRHLRLLEVRAWIAGCLAG